MSNATRRIGLAVALLGLMAGATGRARAGFAPALDIPSSYNFNQGGTHGPDYQSINTYGYSFSVGSQALIVDALASTYFANGNVVIYQGGTTTAIAQAHIHNGDPSTTTSNTTVYGYEAITPVTLKANTTYDIVWSGDAYGEAFNNNVNKSDIIVNVPGITVGSGLSASGLNQFPTGDALATGISFGPNFEALATPEPSSLLQVGTVVLMGLGYRWHRRRGAAARARVVA